MGRIAAGFIVILAMSMVFMFQNCGQAGFDNLEAGDEDSSSLAVDPKLAHLPFPYEVSVNQIAHMSCPLNVSSPTIKTPYFSWKVGAFDNTPGMVTFGYGVRASGLKLRTEFVDEWSKSIQQFNSSLHKEKLKNVLQSLPSVAKTQLQLSLRKANTPRVDLMQMPTGGNSPTTNIMAEISSAEIADQFVTQKDGLFHAFPNVPDFSSRFLEGSLIVPSALGVDAALIANYDASYLTLGFAQGDGNQLVGPGTNNGYAYGKGYRIHFGIARPISGTTLYPSYDSLAVLEEYDLDNGERTEGVAWDCSLKFKIVRRADRYLPVYRANHFATPNNQCPTEPLVSDYCASPLNESFGIHPSFFGGQCPANRKLVLNASHCEERYWAACPDEPYTATLDHKHPALREDGLYHPKYPSRPAILHGLRRFLPADQWDINVSRGCIVPKVDSNACYQSAPIVYDELFFSGANINANLGMYGGCGVNGQYPCSAYLTYCFRR